MPASSEKQRKFMGAELGRLRHGKKTRTGMSEEQLADFARKVHKKGKRGKTTARKQGEALKPKGKK
jgi:hypothetical protein